MILSVSRRTDIPALYGDWFMNRLRAGEVLVRNPLNYNQVTSINLSPENIDCIVFWTKDPGPFLKNLDEIDDRGYKYYFTVTINPYDREIERNVDVKKNIVKSFKSLSGRIGRKRVIWRYDPILFSEKIDEDYHLKWFESLSGELGEYTGKCVFSFLEDYRKTQKNIDGSGIYIPGIDVKKNLLSSMSDIARKYSIKLSACAQTLDFSSIGIERNKCIDDELIEEILRCRIRVSKDRSQRKECCCVESRDIGTYNTCTNGCLYCYANMDKETAYKKISCHDPESPLLCDTLTGNETIIPLKKSGSLKVKGLERQLFL